MGSILQGNPTRTIWKYTSSMEFGYFCSSTPLTHLLKRNTKYECNWARHPFTQSHNRSCQRPVEFRTMKTSRRTRGELALWSPVRVLRRPLSWRHRACRIPKFEQPLIESLCSKTAPSRILSANRYVYSAEMADYLHTQKNNSLCFSLHFRDHPNNFDKERCKSQWNWLCRSKELTFEEE